MSPPASTLPPHFFASTSENLLFRAIFLGSSSVLTAPSRSQPGGGCFVQRWRQRCRDQMSSFTSSSGTASQQPELAPSCLHSQEHTWQGAWGTLEVRRILRSLLRQTHIALIFLTVSYLLWDCPSMPQKHGPVCSKPHRATERNKPALSTCLPPCAVPCNSEPFVLSIEAGTLLYLDGWALHLVVQVVPMACRSQLTSTPRPHALGAHCPALLACLGLSSIQQDSGHPSPLPDMYQQGRESFPNIFSNKITFPLQNSVSHKVLSPHYLI